MLKNKIMKSTLFFIILLLNFVTSNAQNNKIENFTFESDTMKAQFIGLNHMINDSIIISVSHRNKDLNIATFEISYLNFNLFKKIIFSQKHLQESKDTNSLLAVRLDYHLRINDMDYFSEDSLKSIIDETPLCKANSPYGYIDAINCNDLYINFFNLEEIYCFLFNLEKIDSTQVLSDVFKKYFFFKYNTKDYQEWKKNK